MIVFENSPITNLVHKHNRKVLTKKQIHKTGKVNL